MTVLFSDTRELKLISPIDPAGHVCTRENGKVVKW
jgi:hypothetical protein